MNTSYVVTSYNKASFLDQTLSSIEAERAQTGGEIVIVDDGSTDGSQDILAKFKSNNPDTKIIAQENAGVVSATNTGYLHSKCNFIRFCDADDILCRGSSRILLLALTSSNSGLVYGRHETYHAKPGKTAVAAEHCTPKVLADPLKRALKKNLFSPSSTILTRAAASRIFPLPEKFRTSQDYMIGLRACFCCQIAEIEETLSVGPEGGEDRLSSDKARMYGETALFVSEEVSKNLDTWEPADACYALKRNAGRAVLWSRRHHQGLRKRLRLHYLKHSARLHSKRSAAEALAWIARQIYSIPCGSGRS